MSRAMQMHSPRRFQKLQKPLWRFAGVPFILLISILPAFAQRGERRDPGAPDLALDNLTHVAASANQIRAVLQAQPGLLVELKKWAAKDAAGHGQIVNDSDLSDQSIYDRLTADAEFRSVATQLLQRYGYLVPRVNPDSDAAKEQDLVLKERALRIAKREESERGANPAAETKTSGAASDCNPERNANCSPEANYAPRQLGAPKTTTAILPESAPAFDSGPVQTSTSTSSAAATLPMTAGAQSLVVAPNEPPIVSPPEPAQRTVVRLGNNYSRGGAVSGSQPSGMVSRPDPYADIPSLYDMYLQASPHPSQLTRFGEDVFRDGTRDEQLLPMDLPVGPDYVVGPGDGLTIDLWGGVSQRFLRIVDREGRVTLPEAGPVLVSGRTLGEVQQAVQQILRTQFREVSADISLSRLRTIRVYVVGDVEHPGAYDISSLSTPLNALFEAGGPTGRGSLRLLRHYRGKQLIADVDVYDLLLHGIRAGMERLDNGDTVLVPPIGAQITIEGMVRRPALYELHDERSLSEALDLAGGILPAGALRHIEVQRLVAHEKRTMISLDIPEAETPDSLRQQFEAFKIQDGDVVRIFPIAPYNQDAIYLEGHVLRPGRYTYHKGMRLTDVIASFKDLLPEPATKYAEIIRLNPPDFHPSVESFNLAAALENPAAGPALEPLDTIRIYSRFDFQNPPTVTVVGEVRSPGTYVTSGQIHLRDAIQMAGGAGPDAETNDAQVIQRQPDGFLKILDVNLGEALAGNPLDNILLQPRDSIVVHRDLRRVDPANVLIHGEVVRPGRYALTADLRIADLVRLAGGLKRSADSDVADLTHYEPPKQNPSVNEHQEIRLAEALAGVPEQNLLLRDGDVLTIPKLPGWTDIGASVEVGGEVARPGNYGIRPGEKLSSVLQRAGGFLPTAYPEASVFERDEIRRLQEKGKQDLIQKIQQESANFKASVTSSAQDAATLQQTALQQRERTIEALQLAPVTGRMVIHLRENLNEFARSTDDIELRSGDSLFIPKRPNFVLVLGQVYNSNALSFQPHRSASWYLAQAGGATELAEKKAIFIIRANGAVVTGRGGLWTGSVLGRQVQPGDTIVVPERAIGESTTWKNFLGLAQVAQTAAVTAVLVTQ